MKCIPQPYNRRNFLKTTALGVPALLAFSKLQVFAGPFSAEDFTFLIPEDKKLSQAWVDSLFNRGTPEVYSSTKNELKYLAMPIGGIACGMLYLSGEGRLRLWHIFKVEYGREPDHGNRFRAMTVGGHYLWPDDVWTREKRPVDQGALIRVTKGNEIFTRRLDLQGFSNIQFRGEYPVARVTYQDTAYPAKIELEAFSPFIPGNAEESALPVTVLDYKVSNTSNENITVNLVAWLENAVVPFLNDSSFGLRRNTLIKVDGRTTLSMTAERLADSVSQREDIVFEDFESGTYTGWTIAGQAFGSKPYSALFLANYQNMTGYQGSFFINSHNSRDVAPAQAGSDAQLSVAGDAFIGKMTSKTFIINRKFISFLISGGTHPSETAINLYVENMLVRSVTGNNSNTMRAANFEVSQFEGKTAYLEIIDSYTGGWGNIGIDHIVFTDKNAAEGNLEDQHGYGSMALSLLNATAGETIAALQTDTTSPNTITSNLQPLSAITDSSSTKPIGQKINASVGRHFTLAPGESKSATFAISWFFPYLNQQANEAGELLALNSISTLKRHYFNRFNSAVQVADYLKQNANYLLGETRQWNKTFYDSTLPYWLLDRSMISLNCLATNTALWFNNGRFWGWEGVECCQGTCQHVWHYAQGMARIFPEIERYLREKIDLGLMLNANGSMGMRDETAGWGGFQPAHDGHCGTVMRFYREHTMSKDRNFLERNWSNIKKTINFIISEDRDQDGLLEGAQANTLDAEWYGIMGWISSLYQGALVAGKTMALEMNDQAFADRCDQLHQLGMENMVKKLFNGEYFIHKPDPAHSGAINTNDGSLIDQVLGQSLAFQAGLTERVIPEPECKSALKSIWKYNFAPDAYLYQQQNTPIKGARIYAATGEAGTIICTWPKGGVERAVPGMASWPDYSEVWLGPGGYFDECMNGFEHQVASHMIFEGQVKEGLAVFRAVHDRYNANRRNPYNEIECSDHYSRSMASYGVLIAVSGFRYHGPKGLIAFAPKISPENFKVPFTVAEGWGTFKQERSGDHQNACIDLMHGKLNLQEIHLESDNQAKKVNVSIGSQNIPAQFTQEGKTIKITFAPVKIDSTKKLNVVTAFTPLHKTKKLTLRIFPNAAKDELHFEADELLSECAIYSSTGSLMLMSNPQSDSGILNVAHLQPGTYVLQAKGRKNTSNTKFIKQ